MEILPYIIIKNRVLHIRVEASVSFAFHKGEAYMLQTPDGKRWDIIIINRIVTGGGAVYPFTLCGADPVAFVNETCKVVGEKKRKQRVVVAFLDGNGYPFSPMPKLEIHPM
jgi:hypothetical protein